MTSELQRALGARWYTDHGVFLEERRKIFGHTWQLVCHQSELPRPGDYVVRQGIFAIRHPSGTVKAFHNVCRHRGHELLAGKGNRRLITCPYHGWCYDIDGGLKSAPGSDEVPRFDAGSIRLGEVRCEVFCGFVFVNPDRKALPMEDWYPGVEEELRGLVPFIDDLRPVDEVVVEEACNWKVSVENYNECYHCKLRHPTLSSGVLDPDSYDIRPQGHCLRHTTSAAKSDSMTYGIDASDAGASSYSSWYLWPTCSFQVYPGRLLNTFHWEATNHATVTVRRGWYARDGENDATARQLAQLDRETTLAEDIDIVESVQRGLESGHYEPGPLVVNPRGGVMSEHSIATLQSWVREALGAPTV